MDAFRGVVVAGSRAGEIVCLDAVTGDLMWRQQVNGMVTCRPAMDRQRVFFADSSGELIALDIESGQRYWSYQTNGEILAQPVVSGDLVIFTTNADSIIALDKRSGKWKWHYKKELPKEMTIWGVAGPVVAGTGKDGKKLVVLAGFSDGKLYALDPSDGSLLWSKDISSGAEHFMDVDADPVFLGDRIYTSSYSGGLYSLKASNGKVVWSNAEATGITGIARSPGILWTVSHKDGLRAFSARDGTKIFSAMPSGWSRPVKPIVHGNLLLVPTVKGPLFIFNAYTGELIQSFATGFGFSSTPAVGLGRAFLLSNGGILYAFKIGKLGYLDVGLGGRYEGKKLFGPEIIEQFPSHF